jgi:hypothetical protein
MVVGVDERWRDDGIWGLNDLSRGELVTQLVVQVGSLNAATLDRDTPAEARRLRRVGPHGFSEDEDWAHSE